MSVCPIILTHIECTYSLLKKNITNYVRVILSLLNVFLNCKMVDNFQIVIKTESENLLGWLDSFFIQVHFHTFHLRT